MTLTPTYPAFQLDLLIRQMKAKAEQLYLDMGASLYIMDKDRLYLQLGYETFRAYLANPEISLPKTTAYRMIRNYETYILQLGVPTLGLLKVGETKLEIMRPYIDEGNKDELISIGQSLSISDLIDELSERYNGGVRIRPKVDWEQVADSLYLDLFQLDNTCQMPSCKRYQEAKAQMKREGWDE